VGRYDWERALLASDQPPWAKRAGLAMATHYPCVRPGIDRLGREMGLSGRTARRAVAQLRKDGWIRQLSLPAGAGRGRVGKHGTATVWALEIPAKRLATSGRSLAKRAATGDRKGRPLVSA
jgi:hypothetical protein